MKCIEILFWIAVFLVFYTYLGYGIFLWILVKLKELCLKPVRKILPGEAQLPHVTLFIAAYNEQDVVDAKMANSLALDYPPGKLVILWVTDGSDDNSVQMLQAYAASRKEGEPVVRVEHDARRGGKAAAFNRGIDFVTSPLVIFTDANTLLNREAVKEIVREFTDKKVGCVAGEKRVSESMNVNTDNGFTDAAATEGVYWKYESILKYLDYRLYSAVGAAGELFAIRTGLFEKLSPDTLLDDFILSMRIAGKGYKIAYCSNACAVEGTSANLKEEGKRKVRISAGGLQSVGRLLPLLNIFKYGVLSFQYISHRVLRWTLTPLCLLLLLPLNLLLLDEGPVYRWIFILQMLFYCMGIAGGILSAKGKKNKLLYIAYYFLFMNYNVFRGVGYLCKKKTGVWEKAKRR